MLSSADLTDVLSVRRPYWANSKHHCVAPMHCKPIWFWTDATLCSVCTQRSSPRLLLDLPVAATFV